MQAQREKAECVCGGGVVGGGEGTGSASIFAHVQDNGKRLIPSSAFPSVSWLGALLA